MKAIIKEFDELTTSELYKILKLRAEIFVVEQNCPYQDLDDKDYFSLHIFSEQDKKVVAYARIFPKNDDPDTVQMGRVVTLKHGSGLGARLMEEGIKAIKERTDAKKIYLEGQTYCIGFYEKFGFKVISDEFILDGIPHVKMQLEL